MHPDFSVDPYGVCIFTCKRNSLRFKHFCGAFGRWDVKPGSISCASYDHVEDNYGNDPCPSINFNNENGWLHCKSLTTKGKLLQTCLLNCDPGFSAAPSEMFLCHIDDRIWQHFNGQDLINSQNVSCQPSVAVVTDGKDIEIYHPIKKFEQIMPDFPAILDNILGFWIHGQLVFCGQDSSMKCYLLAKNNTGHWEWVSHPDPIYYLRSVGASLVRPHRDWSLYAIGGSIPSYHKSVRVYDPITSALHENKHAFPHGLNDSPCAIAWENDDLLVVDENYFYWKNVTEISNEWMQQRHDLQLKPRCLKLDNGQLLMIDKAKKYLMKSMGVIESLDIVLNRDNNQVELAMLNGLPTVFKHEEILVEQIDLAGSADGEAVVVSAPNPLAKPRTSLIVVQVPKFLFQDLET